MRCLITMLTLAIASSDLAMSGALAQESWVGKTIVVKNYDSPIKIGYTDDQGRQVHVGELKRLNYKVTGDQGGWLKVTNEDDISGWFDKSQAVLLQDAPAYFTELIRRKPSDPMELAQLYADRGWCWHLLKQNDKAIEDYTEALRLDPDWPLHYVSRAFVWEKEREYAKAIADYTQALRLDPTARTYVDRGACYRRMREYAKALADYASALRIDPKNISAYDYQAWLLATCPDSKYRDGKKAVALAKQGLELAPDYASMMDTLAAAYAEIGDFAQAIYWQERALQDPSWDGPAERRRLESYRKNEPVRY